MARSWSVVAGAGATVPGTAGRLPVFGSLWATDTATGTVTRASALLRFRRMELDASEVSRRAQDVSTGRNVGRNVGRSVGRSYSCGKLKARVLILSGDC